MPLRTRFRIPHGDEIREYLLSFYIVQPDRKTTNLRNEKQTAVAFIVLDELRAIKTTS